MREDFLHYLWRLARFDLRDLRTTRGEPITIQHFGIHNTNAGPDFGEARLRIDGLQWAGKVEMHVKSSEWYAHGHDTDSAYDGVILHVVLEEDRVVYRRDGTRIPCLELNGRIPAGVRNRYWRLMHGANWVPCERGLPEVGDPVRRIWLQRVLAERLNRRAKAFATRLDRSGRDWEQAFYELVARAMGGSVNAEAMEMLARSLPLRVVLKHKHSLLQLEALFFGQSALLPAAEDGEDGYVTRLRREYALLRTKHGLNPIPAASWRFLRMRPNNFPTVRIAQLACLCYRSGQLFGKALAAVGAKELTNMFDVSLSNYWRTHYRFGPAVKAGERRLGTQTIRLLLINAVAPAYVAYARARREDRYRERALDLLEELPAERNAVVDRWRKLGWSAGSAAESQALLELKHEYCDARRCTSCTVGCAILGLDTETNEDEVFAFEEEAAEYLVAG